jgi:DtxR family Mn-dependent transcriptional regulator
MTTTRSATAVIEDYAKAIYALQERGEGAVTTTALAEVLDMPWDRVHDEAEVLEHVLSEELEGLIAAKLGNPTADPHGDPIPSAELELPEQRCVALQELEPGEHGIFRRVSDADPEMLRWLAGRAVRPGDALEVLDKQPFGGPLTVRVADAVHVLGGGIAAAMRIELA